MNLPIKFQSLDLIVGKERKSKLLHQDSDLYSVLHQIKQAIKEHYQVGADRMDLHIELTKVKDDPALRTKTESLENQELSLIDQENWGYLGRAFVLWTPEVIDYGKTHITIAFFGNKPKPDVKQLQALVFSILNKLD